MKNYKWWIILINLLLLLGYVNWSIAQKENTLAAGQLILLQLAPVDPRSLMQGDYMRLNYAIARLDSADVAGKRGYCVLKLTTNKVGEKIRVQPEPLPLHQGEVLVKYRTATDWTSSMNIGAESYFFQEGKGETFEKAKYGGLRVDEAGNSILVGLYDETFTLLVP
jgi:uncharacterized membrane-anchored protein